MERTHEIARELRRIADELDGIGADPREWGRLGAALEEITRLLHRRRDDLEAPDGPAGHPHRSVRLTARCHPVVGRQLRLAARAVGLTPGRLAARVVEEFIRAPELWHPLPFEVQRLAGPDRLTTSVRPAVKAELEGHVERLDSVRTTSQLLGWLLWNRIGRPEIPGRP